MWITTTSNIYLKKYNEQKVWNFIKFDGIYPHWSDFAPCKYKNQDGLYYLYILKIKTKLLSLPQQRTSGFPLLPEAQKHWAIPFIFLHSAPVPHVFLLHGSTKFQKDKTIWKIYLK